MSSRKTTLETINKYSLEIYILIKTKKLKKELVYNTLLDRDTSLLLNSIKNISKSKTNDLKENYNKINCFDEVLYITDNKYHHLKEIRDIVDINNIIETVISDEIYDKKLRAYYTDLVLELLMEDYYDYSSMKLFSNYKKELIELNQKLNNKIMKNIDTFYIQKITI